MHLDSYLQAIETCPDKVVPTKGYVPRWRLQHYFGLHGNFGILVPEEKIIEDLIKSITENSLFTLRYDFSGTTEDENAGKRSFFHNVSLKGLTGVSIGIRWGLIPFQDCTYDSPKFIHRDRQIRDYKFCINLETEGTRKDHMEGKIPMGRSMADVIIDICHYAQREKMPLCLPFAYDGVHPEKHHPIYFNPI